MGWICCKVLTVQWGGSVDVKLTVLWGGSVDVNLTQTNGVDLL